jgi:hypothetical protein
VWPVVSGLLVCPQRSLSKIEAIGSKIGLHISKIQISLELQRINMIV